MKRYLVGFATVMVATFLCTGVAYSQWVIGKGNKAANNGMAKDPVCRKYIQFRPVMGGNFNPLFYKVQPAKLVGRYNSRCAKSLLKCKVGWDAAAGHPMPGVKQFFTDSLAIANWAGFWQYKFQVVDTYAGPRAMYGAVLFKVPKAADLIAQSLLTRKRFVNLYGGPRRTTFVDEAAMYPYLALFYLGAKSKADLMISQLSIVGAHQHHFLNFAHFWKLSKAQKRKIQATCLKILGMTSAKLRVKRSCVRYLARIGFKSSDFRSHLLTFASQSASYEGMDAVRALGILKIKRAKKQLKAILSRGKKIKKRRVGKRRRSRKVKLTTWVGNDNMASAAVALAAMGDRKAMKPIKYWLSLSDRGLVDARGYTALVFEATLTSPAMQKKLAKLIKKTLKKLRSFTRSNMARAYRHGHMALLQMGDKVGLKHVMGVLGGHDKRAIKETLQQLGGMLKPLAHRHRGIQRIRVGKGGIKVRDAKKLLAKIQSRMRFWADKRMKMYATQVIMELMGLIKAARL